jgi:hypothetical protein
MQLIVALVNSGIKPTIDAWCEAPGREVEQSLTCEAERHALWVDGADPTSAA